MEAEKWGSAVNTEEEEESKDKMAGKKEMTLTGGEKEAR